MTVPPGNQLIVSSENLKVPEVETVSLRTSHELKCSIFFKLKMLKTDLKSRWLALSEAS